MSQNTLPTPPDDLLAHSQKLVSLIAHEIDRSHGWISFEHFMHLALYTPELGYYAGAMTKFGEQGDFVTAPEMGSLYGRTLAQQVLQVCLHSSRQVMEFGAGSGALACDILTAFELRGEPLEHYFIVEVSAYLRARQQHTIALRAPHWLERVSWLDALPAEFSGCIVANEVLDAMPVKLWHQTEHLAERGVSVSVNPDKTELIWADRPADDALVNAIRDRIPAQFAPYLSEWGAQGEAFAATLAQMLQQGALLLVDYGFTQAEYFHPQRNTGTLMCHYRHRAHDDPLLWPGLCDITAHVDFTAIARAGQAAGLDLMGYTSQANFLINAGVAQVLQQLQQESPEDWSRHTHAARQLMSEAHMGELFKAMLLCKNMNSSDFQPLGFTLKDRRASL